MWYYRFGPSLSPGAAARPASSKVCSTRLALVRLALVGGRRQMIQVYLEFPLSGGIPWDPVFKYLLEYKVREAACRKVFP